MKDRLISIGGIITAVLSVSCCLGPFLFILFGITGLGFLTQFAWLRPYLLLVTFVLVGIAYHYSYGKGNKCEIEGSCNTRTQTINRVLFWLLVAFAVFGLSFPYIAGLFI